MKILFPTDFSDDAYSALFFAANLFSSEACEFHIMHTTTTVASRKFSHSPGTEPTTQSIETDEDIKCKLEETMHRIVLDTEKNPNHQFSYSYKKLPLTKAIESHVELYPVDLVVMGNKGRKGAKEIFFGNNTLQVVKSIIPCPILCVPRQIDFKPPERIGFLADYNHSLFGPELKHLSRLTELYKAVLHIVHLGQDNPLDTKQQKNRKELDHLLRKHDPHYHLVPYRRNKSQAIRKFVQNQRIDLLVMIYYRHFLISKLLREPVVLDLSFYLDIPLLIIPDKD